MKALTYVELDIPWCSRVYGVAPCTASVPTTGADKCCNTLATCQDTPNYNESTVTLRFAVDAYYRPRDIDAIPCILSVEHTPGRVSLGENLGERSMLKVMLLDHKHSDAGQGFDKYFDERSYDPYEQGTLFGKFRVRQPFLRGRALRWYQGFEGDALGAMEVRHFLVDSVDGPNEIGVYTLIGKDVLKLLDGDRAQAPALSSGFLDDDITDVATTLDLLPAGAGTEYGTTGYVCIGGSEICSFERDANGDVNGLRAVLLMHIGGSDGGTNFVDFSPAARTLTTNGNAVIDDAQTKFGLNSLKLDGTGDYVSAADSNDFNLNTNFIIDCWIRPSTLNSGRAFSHASSSTVGYRMLVTSGGVLTFSIHDTSTLLTLSSASSAIVTGAWTHIAIERYGNIWTLYVNGDAVATTTSNPTLPTITATFKVGAGESGNNGFTGWIDEFRFVRGSGAAHEAEDRVQLVLLYVTKSPADIIYDLEVTYAGVPSAYIDLPAWQTEIGLFLGQVYTVTIPEPTPVKDLVRELIEQAGLMHWEDDTAPALRLRVIRQVSATQRITERERLDGSFTIKDQPEKRISRVQTYYGIKDPTKSIEDADNYRSVELTIDDEAESPDSGYGTVAIKTIMSRFIPQFGGAIAAKLNDILLARYRDAPRLMSWQVMRSDDVPVLCDGYQVAAPFLQDQYGAPADSPVQAVRLVAGPAIIEVEAEEMLLEGTFNTDPNVHTVIIDSNTNNFNLRTQHDALYGTPITGNEIVCIVSEGVIVGSTSAAAYAFDQGTWPGDVTVALEVNGRIQGKGGNGGASGWRRSVSPTSQIDPTDGDDGGTALKVRSTLALSGTGEIWGGGGGGGGGTFDIVTEPGGSAGGGGGGGQGSTRGSGGAGRHDGDNGTDATTEAIGVGGNGDNGGTDGGDGGGPGDAGVDANNGPDGDPAGDGGAAGKAIEGDSFVTETGTLDVQGTRT